MLLRLPAGRRTSWKQESTTGPAGGIKDFLHGLVCVAANVTDHRASRWHGYRVEHLRRPVDAGAFSRMSGAGGQTARHLGKKGERSWDAALLEALSRQGS
jgi:hypothetical protein